MAKVKFIPTHDEQDLEPGNRLLDALLASNYPVMMACGGQGICATCHVYLRDGAEHVSPCSDRETRTLALITGATSESRLSCQTIMQQEGTVLVELPEGLYVESVSDLETLIGRRANKPILHPIDGRVLIQKGKIITRTRIMELGDLNFDPLDIDMI